MTVLSGNDIAALGIGVPAVIGAWHALWTKVKPTVVKGLPVVVREGEKVATAVAPFIPPADQATYRALVADAERVLASLQAIAPAPAQSAMPRGN